MDLSTSTSSLSSSSSGFWSARGRDRLSSTGTGLLDKILCAVVTCVFTVVGSSVGAVTGGLIGLATESGLFRGAGIGAISGAVFMVEVVESSLALWHSNESGIWSVLYLVDIITSLLSGRLVREKVGPAVQSAVQNQMNAISTPFIEDLDIFETGGTRGMSRDSVNNIPKIKLTKENTVDASGEKICCSVCLQDFQIKETARVLPHCQHMFHLPCIDSWLIRYEKGEAIRRQQLQLLEDSDEGLYQKDLYALLKGVDAGMGKLGEQEWNVLDCKALDVIWGSLSEKVFFNIANETMTSSLTEALE